MTRSDRLKARQPRGFVDRGAAEVAATERMLARIRESFESFGFEPVETPFVEYTDALGKFLPDQDRPNEGVFSFQDDDEQWLSLRYDLTAPLARHVAENFDTLPKPYRSYRSGWVFRNEKPGPGRFRQFMQFDADIVGAGSVAADAEICMLAADTMEALGIARGDYVVKVNNRKVLDGVMEAIGLGGDENAGRRLTVLRAIDKLDKFGEEGVRQLLEGGRWDGGEPGKGDFTKGAGLEPTQSQSLLIMLFSDPSMSIADSWQRRLADDPKGYTRAGLQELSEIESLVRRGGYDRDRVVIDRSIVRGLEYYTGPVYEVELTFPVTNEDGQVVRFGSVAGGGRYDGLVGRFRPEPVPATGFSIGVSRLFAALKAVGSPLVDARNELPLVVVTTMDNKTPEHMPAYQALVSKLRRARDGEGRPVMRADLYLGSSGFNAQMKYADRRGAACAIIQGSSEREAGTVLIKDLALGAELAALGREGRDREDYLARQAEAQFAVPEAELVAGVMKVLARRRGG